MEKYRLHAASFDATPGSPFGYAMFAPSDLVGILHPLNTKINLCGQMSPKAQVAVAKGFADGGK